MKKIILITALFLMVTVVARAETTSKGDYPLVGGSTHTTAIREHVHQYINTDTNTDTNTMRNKRETPLGVGADILLTEHKYVDTEAEYKYDFNNEEHSAFLVVKTKKSLWSIVKNLFTKE